MAETLSVDPRRMHSSKRCSHTLPSPCRSSSIFSDAVGEFDTHPRHDNTRLICLGGGGEVATCTARHQTALRFEQLTMPNLLTPWITPLRINATPVSFMVLSSQWQAFEGAQPKLPRDGSCSSTKLMLSNTTRKASSTILPRCRAGKWALRL